MTKFILNTISIFLMCLCALPCSANKAHGEEILFCTKNIAVLESSQSSQHGSPTQVSNDEFCVYDSLRHGQHNFPDARHCFVALAKVKKRENGRISMYGLETFGYWGLPEELREPNTRSGTVGQESDLDKAVVGCVTVFRGSIESRLDKEWAQVTGNMRASSREKDYNAGEHNCCTVAYKALADAKGHLSAINPGDFNLRGLGILWTCDEKDKISCLSSKLSIQSAEVTDFSSSMTCVNNLPEVTVVAEDKNEENKDL